MKPTYSYLDAAARGHLADSFHTQLHKFPRIDSLLDKTANEIVSHLKQFTPISTLDLAALISEIAMAQNYSDSSKTAAIEMIFSYIGKHPSLAVIDYLTNYHLDEFQNLVSIYTPCTQLQLKESKLSLLINEWIDNNDQLIDAFFTKLITNDSFENKKANGNILLINTFLELINTKHLPLASSKIIRIIDVTDNTHMASFLNKLSEESTCQVFIEEWITYIQKDLKKYCSLVIEMAKQPDLHQAKSFIPLKKLLKKAGSFNSSTVDYTEQLALNIIKNCQPVQQAYILCCAEPRLCKAIARKSPKQLKDKITLLKTAFKLRKKYAFRKNIVLTSINNIARKNIQRFYCELAKMNHMKLLSYLFLTKWRNRNYSFLEFVESSTPEFKTRLFNQMSSLDPLELRSLIIDLKSSRLLRPILDKATFLVPSESNFFTFPNICRNLTHLLAGLERLNQSLEKIPYWEAIPPIFLAFGLFDDSFKPVVLKSFCYMTASQRDTVIAVLSAGNDIAALDTLISYDTNEGNAYALMPEKTLLKYCEEKVVHLKEKTLEFYQRYAKYKEAVSVYLSKNLSEVPQPSLEEFNYLNDELIILINFFKIAETAPYQKLFRILSKKAARDLNAYEIEFREKINNIKNLQTNFLSKNYGKLLTELEAQFPCLKATEDKDFPDHFLGMLTPSVQTNFGFSGKRVLPELNDAGICSENDLKQLGYNAEKENILQIGSKYILDNIPRSSNMKLANECEDEWHRMYSNPFTSFFPAYVDSFINHTTFLKQSTKFKIEITKRLLKELEKLALLNVCKVDNESIKKLQTELTPEAADDVITSVCKKTLTLFMNTYRHHIIPALGHYLNQKDLKTSWKTLRGQGYQTLESLDDMGFIPNADSLLNMASLVSTLFPQRVGHV